MIRKYINLPYPLVLIINLKATQQKADDDRKFKELQDTSYKDKLQSQRENKETIERMRTEYMFKVRKSFSRFPQRLTSLTPNTAT